MNELLDHLTKIEKEIEKELKRLAALAAGWRKAFKVLAKKYRELKGQK